MRADGRNFATEIYSPQEFRQALLNKLVEEAEEARSAATSNSNYDALLNELADLYEVIDVILATYQLDKNQLLTTQLSRQQERGGFSKQLKLLWTI